MPRTVVCGAISEEMGHVHYMYGVRSFNQDDMIEMLRGIRQAIGPGRIACFWDNASIHTAHRVRIAAAKEDIKIELAFNASYRPDCNGIEMVWARMKQRYRARVDYNKANNEEWDN